MDGRVCWIIVLIIPMNFEFARGQDLWCYECNTDLRDGHTTECNDPYSPSPYFDLVLCSRNESQHCLKSIIDYGGVLVTVRGCVPSRKIDGYCQPEKYFPGSSIACSLCDDYACNSERSTYSYALQRVSLLFILSGITLLQ